MHPRNRHQERYDLAALTAASPPLARHVRANRHDPVAGPTLDFSDPDAVKELNRALLLHDYGVRDWDIPEGYLCPPVPGRADYVHFLADLLASSNGGVLPKPDQVTVLDLGTGANGVYPLLGHAEYGWHFIGADIEVAALDSVRQILLANERFAAAIELRLQRSSGRCFSGILKPGEVIDLSMCNPPFHASAADARGGTERKLKNLRAPSGSAVRRPVGGSARNFGGQAGELWCEGGERGFVLRMVEESRRFADRCFWFSSLISRAANLPAISAAIRQAGAFELRIVDMAQGQKQSRFVAWTYLDRPAQARWRAQRWGGPDPEGSRR